MSLPIIEINRAKVGSNNHVLLYLDTICNQENLPKADIIFLALHEPPLVARRYIPGIPGIHIVLPIPLIPFISFQELEMVVYWAFLNSNPISSSSLGQLLTRFGYEDGLGILAKMESILGLWDYFQTTEDFKYLTKNEPLKVLSEFELILKSEVMLIVSESTIKHSKRISRIVKELNTTQLSNFIDNAVLLRTNKVFSLEDADFVQIVSDLILDFSKENNQTG